MIVQPGLLVAPAQAANMDVPNDPDSFNREDFPHFHVFCHLQLGRSMTSWQEHWDNAKIIANIPVEKLTRMTVEEFTAAGVLGLE